ncbi:hypothetical protein I6A84_04310 [Frankia sp. CNm7]|uniref:Solute-binding protein family 5 domain-containing protein n=1 Tax=Frankia nepalensis TaxID=1836974 RepID=A0A937UTU8_9ACTN|nr:ABC transporter substrate-binding protein [Frankia nepalensis]MBL7501995.1 hypothetical protein [Frankia nepalensis]MBL7510625.1 hypothetical protein [Frankia nepalensis]MBL7517365.1 hypothetical protein [Frankia nepalensis]MBL7633448.1 hypothetical protein [Frankia nepalensis]
MATVLAITGCSSSSDNSDDGSGQGPSGTVRVGIEEIPSQWVPGTDNGYAWVRVPYETLVGRAPDDPTQISPQLATKWEQTPESITFTLRDDVTFHDGTPFNAEAAKFNLEYVIEQAGPFSAGLSSISSIETPDELTLVLNLARPTQSLLSALTGRGGVMASPAAIEDGTIDDHPVGTGPWAYDQSLSVPGSEVGFSLYDGYWDIDNVGVRQIVLVAIDDSDARINALLTGEVDLGDVLVAQADQARDGGLEVDVFPGVHYGLLLLDRGPGGALEDLAVRRATCQSIDSEGLAAVGGGEYLTATNQRFQEGEYGHNGDIPPLKFDATAAEPQLDGVPPLTMLAFEQTQLFAEAISGMLGEVGVTLDVQTVTAGEYFTGWYAGTNSMGLGDNTDLTPEEWYTRWFAADAPGNPAGVESPELAAAAEKALAETGVAAAEPLWSDVMGIIAQESLVCNETIVNQAMGYKPGQVEGVQTVTWEASSVVFKSLRKGN